MLPATYDMELYRGDTFRRTFRLQLVDARGVPIVDPDTTSPGHPDRAYSYIDLRGCTVLAQVRAREGDPTVLAEFTPEVLDTTTPPDPPDPDTKGKVTLSLTNRQTANLAGGKWDLQVVTGPIDEPADVRTYLAGKITARGQITVGAEETPVP